MRIVRKIGSRTDTKATYIGSKAVPYVQGMVEKQRQYDQGCDCQQYTLGGEWAEVSREKLIHRSKAILRGHLVLCLGVCIAL